MQSQQYISLLYGLLIVFILLNGCARTGSGAEDESLESDLVDGGIEFSSEDSDLVLVIPSGLSLVTGVLDKKFGFWNLPEEKRQHYIERLYKALIELQLRFHDDWINERFDRKKVMIVRFDRMMTNFEDLMEDIIDFKKSPDL